MHSCKPLEDLVIAFQNEINTAVKLTQNGFCYCKDVLTIEYIILRHEKHASMTVFKVDKLGCVREWWFS